MLYYKCLKEEWNMFRLTIRVFRNHYKGDTVSHIETLYVNGTQLENWLRRGDTNDVKIISWGKA